MCVNTFTGTEDIIHDNGRAVSIVFTSYCYHRILFHAAYLAATIDGTSRRAVTYGAVTNGDIRVFGHHSFTTPKGAVTTR